MKLRAKSPDFILFAATLCLLGIGVVMVFSSSQVTAGRIYHDNFYFLKKQLMWTLLGIIALVGAMNYDYWRIRKWAVPGLVIAFVLLILVLVPGIGVEVNGAQRWLGVGSIRLFQPSEIIKLAFVIFMAHVLSVHPVKIRGFGKGLLPFLVLLGAACLLILKQPDLGTALSLAATVYIMFFAGGAQGGHLFGLALAGIAAVGAAIVVAPYRLKRFMAFLDPWADPQGSGYHIIQALYAIGSGGLFGLGLGRSHQKFFYLPEQHTDFIFAILSEELGFVGGALIIFLFIVFIWRGFKIAVGSEDPFASMLAVGITSMIALQATINLGAVTSTMPITGIPLPLLSFGGTSLLFTLLGVGILLNISRYVSSK